MGNPESRSLHLAQRALGLQAHDLLRRPWRSADPTRSQNEKDTRLGVFFILVAGVGFELPARKHSRLGRVRAARFRYSLFSPLSTSFHLAQRALGLQAHDLLRRPWRSAAPTRSQKEKQPQRVAFFLVAGVGFEPHGLRVMSPTSYQAALPRDILVPETGIEPVRDVSLTGF